MNRDHGGNGISARLRLRLLVALVTFAVPGCGSPPVDVVSTLPRQIAGNTLQYNRTDGAQLRAQDPEAWQLAIGQAVGAPADAVTAWSGYLDPRIGYNSDVIQVHGGSAPRLLEAVIGAMAAGGPRRVDTIAGKPVTRALPPGLPESALDAAPYFYAWGDTVIVIVAADPSFALEAFEALP